MLHQIVQIEGINVITQENGDIKVILHLADLNKSLETIPTLNNRTHVLVARKRSTLSAKGHSHDKPVAKVYQAQSDEQVKTPS